jgi:hypothetical protein
MATDPHQVHLSSEEWKLLTELSSSTGKRPEQVLSEALRRYEPQKSSQMTSENGQKSVYDSLAESGFIGCIQGGPADLSTNPTYMEGFGE